MTSIDSTKNDELNEILDEKLKEERNEWTKKILDLIKTLGDDSKLNEMQITQLSYRQMVQEKITEYKILLLRREESFNKRWVERYKEYNGRYEIKLTQSAITNFIKSDFGSHLRTMDMLRTEINYMEQIIKTLDNLGFAIKNKIEILTQQLT